ncbi:DUF2177 family protein [Candidatus Nomurabacteria bacterium]|nr:DUF2177 family protein [Candidatus Nomurabacteria bacterium]
MKIILGYFLTFLSFFLIDMLWLGFLAKGVYKKYLGSIIGQEVNWPPAMIFYLLFVLGVVVFVIWPAIEKNSLTHAILFGLFFGLVTYATYDLTNYATIKNWPLQIVLIDLAWGSVLSMIVAFVGFYIFKYLK